MLSARRLPLAKAYSIRSVYWTIRLALLEERFALPTALPTSKRPTGDYAGPCKQHRMGSTRTSRRSTHRTGTVQCAVLYCTATSFRPGPLSTEPRSLAWRAVGVAALQRSRPPLGPCVSASSSIAVKRLTYDRATSEPLRAVSDKVQQFPPPHSHRKSRREVR